MTGTAEEALSVLSQPTSCCDNVSDLGRDNTTQGTGEERAAEVKKLNYKPELGRLLLNEPLRKLIIFL